MGSRNGLHTALLTGTLSVALILMGALPAFAEQKADADEKANPLSRMTPVSDEAMARIEGRSRHSAGPAVLQIHTQDVIRQIEVDNHDVYRGSHANQTRQIRLEGELPRADHDDLVDQRRNDRVNSRANRLSLPLPLGGASNR